MSDSLADHDDDEDRIGIPRSLAATLGSDTESEGEEENNNVDNEDDDSAPSSPVYEAPRSPVELEEDREEEEIDAGDFPAGVENEIVVDNDEDVNINVNNMGNNINVSREGDVEIVGEDIAVEIVSETAVIPDTTEDDTDDDIAEDEEYTPLPVINTATTEEVLGISSDSDTGGTVEAAEDTLEAGEADLGYTSREPSPQPGPSTSGGQASGQSEQVVALESRSSGVVRCSRGKRLPWRDPDYNDTSDSEEDEVSVPASATITASASSSSVTAPGDSTTPPSGNLVLRLQRCAQPSHSSSARNRGDFNERRFWRQMSSSNEDLGSIEPTVSPATSSGIEAVPEVRVRPVSSLQRPGPSTINYNNPLTIEGLPTRLIGSDRNTQDGFRNSMSVGCRQRQEEPPAAQGSFGSPNIQSSRPSNVSVALPNTTIRRIIPINNPNQITLQPTLPLGPAEPRPRSPLPSLLHMPPRSRSHSPVSPPQSALYSPIQLPTFPPINPPRFVPGRVRARSPSPNNPLSPPEASRDSTFEQRLTGQDRALPRPSSPMMPIQTPPHLRRNPPSENLMTYAEYRQHRNSRDDRLRRSGEDTDRIDRILELSRRSRGFEAQRDRDRQEEGRRVGDPALERARDRQGQRLEDFRREFELNERARVTARRSFERAASVLGASNAPPAPSQILDSLQPTPRLHSSIHPFINRNFLSHGRNRDEDLASEFVRDSPEPESATAAKRPRLAGDQENSTQYDADIAEALTRSLADQGGAAPEAPASASGDQAIAEPQPGCSHWGAGTEPVIAETEVPAPDETDPVLVQARAAEQNTPNYEAMYTSLLETNRRLVQELQSSLECPVCLETIRSAPVKCCRNGHLICNTCVTRAQNCPTCRVPMGMTMSMKCVSHVANRLIDLLPHPCTNKDRGCPVEELLTVLTGHETECRFRDVRCPVGYCHETVPMSSLATHMSSQPHHLATRACDGAGVLSHTRCIPGPPIQDGNTAQLMKSHEPVRFTFAGEAFYLQTIVSQDKRFLYHFVQMEGSKADCSRFEVRISVMGCSAFTSARASSTTWPSTLDQHCREDLIAIGNAAITQEK